jgi:hypothetical protein
VTSIAYSAFHSSGVTSIIASGWTTTDGLVMRLGKVFCCLGEPSSIRIPGTVREIGDKVFSENHRLLDLSFEEGILKIGADAFSECCNLKTAAFPASLTTIEERAFHCCSCLGEISFAVGSQLQYIRTEAFKHCLPAHRQIKVVIPASIREIDPSAFSGEAWRHYIQFEGPPLVSINDDCILSLDSRVLFLPRSEEKRVSIGSNIEVIGANAFRGHYTTTVLFESGTRLREIGRESFAGCHQLASFNVPESVEILGDRCFASCPKMETIRFEGSSRLKRIGEQAFIGSRLHSITIPALAEEIDGSAFVNCELMSIQVAAGSLNFKIEGNILLRSDETEIVRYFGLDREVLIGRKVKVLGKSCFEGCKYLDQIDFETGSELERISQAALRGCASLIGIEIPSSVAIFEESSFDRCTELESCLMHKDSSLVTIGTRAFANCTLLRSFNISRVVDGIGGNAFNQCIHLDRLKFRSLESLKRVVGARSLDDALDEFGVSGNSSLFKIEIDDVEADLRFPGWVSLRDGDGDLHLTLVRDLQ